MEDGDACSDIVVHGDLLRHVHVATTVRRVTPGTEPRDFGPFFGSLVRTGYDGRGSIEAGIADPATELPNALSLMRRLLSSATDTRPACAGCRPN
jgi:sugar phosphate isomerase/epimerase